MFFLVFFSWKSASEPRPPPHIYSGTTAPGPGAATRAKHGALHVAKAVRTKALPWPSGRGRAGCSAGQGAGIWAVNGVLSMVPETSVFSPDHIWDQERVTSWVASPMSIVMSASTSPVGECDTSPVAAASST